MPFADIALIDRVLYQRISIVYSSEVLRTPRERLCIGSKENIEYRLFLNAELKNEKLEKTGPAKINESLSVAARAVAAERVRKLSVRSFFGSEIVRRMGLVDTDRQSPCVRKIR